MITKARDVRERLKGRVDPQVSYVLESIVERQNVLDKGVAELAGMLDKMMTIQVNTVAVAEQMKNFIDGMKAPEGLEGMRREQ